MMNNELNTIILETLNNADITSNDIPSIDLYMDQIISLIDNKLSANKRFESDKILTKTMINNYSKEGLIKPVKGKKYTKEQILQMIIIYSMKNTDFSYRANRIGYKRRGGMGESGAVRRPLSRSFSPGPGYTGQGNVGRTFPNR